MAYNMFAIDDNRISLVRWLVYPKMMFGLLSDFVVKSSVGLSMPVLSTYTSCDSLVISALEEFALNAKV